MTNRELAIAAWGAVRNPDDAEWIKLPIGIKAKLVDLAGKYRAGAKVHEGDYPPEGFAEKVFELAQPPQVVFDSTIFDSSKSATIELGNSVAIDKDAEIGVGTRPLGSAEHEDTRIPSPNPEDVDPLKDEMADANLKGEPTKKSAKKSKK